MSSAAGVKRKDRTVRRRPFGRSRPRRRVQADNSAIQGLFELSRAIFMGPGTVPPPKDVTMLHLFLDKMKPEDFGLSADLELFNASSPVTATPTITYSTIYNCDNFSMCIFFLPPTAVIPLHNHPGMTVFSKLLLGTIHITSYDWVVPAVSEEATPSKFRLVRRVVDADLTAPCETCTLYPAAGGNMHTFRAITPCVVLDVLGPPYSKEDDRDCTYYRHHPYAHFSEGSAGRAGELEDGLGWLEEREMPKELKMVGVEYLGPQIIDR